MAVPTRPQLALALALAGATASTGGCTSDDPSAAPPLAGAGPGVATCGDGGVAAWPAPPYAVEVLGTIPPGLSFEGPDGAVRIDEVYEPCADRSRLLVVRSSAAWCGPCLWHAEHTARFADDPRFAGRLILVDLLIADEDNMPATTAAASRWRDRVGPARRVGIDPRYAFAGALIARAPLPEYVFIDTRTMRILGTLSDPDPESLSARVEIELAELDGLPRPRPRSPSLVDGHFTENEADMIRGMRLVADPPPDPTNAYADVAAAAAFGAELFGDVALSPSGKVSCATCHDPSLDLVDRLPQSRGVAQVDRNSPAIALAAHARWQFWDGRADTLWMQALGPIEDPREMGSSRLFVAHRVADAWAARYAAVFGGAFPLPAEIATWPANGKPGDAAYDALSPAVKDDATRILVNVGKAIAAFERALRVRPNALDRYAAGDVHALGDGEKHALSLFLKNGCVQCHWGPRLTDDAFHALRFGTGRQDGVPDPGRVDGLLRLAGAEFLASSRWSDAPAAAKPFLADAPVMLGAFKTPTLRGLPTSAPYGHGGDLVTLADVTRHYGNRGLEHADPRAVGATETWVPNFDAAAARDLVPFLDALGAMVELPSFP